MYALTYEEGRPGCLFTGGEANSVILFIDKFNCEYTAHLDAYYDMILLACSRAAFELEIYVHEDLNTLFQRLLRCKHPKLYSSIDGFLETIKTLEADGDTAEKMMKCEEIVEGVIDGKVPKDLLGDYKQRDPASNGAYFSKSTP